MNNDKKQIFWLNSIKGIACWIVFLGHFQEDYGYVPFLRYVLAMPVFGFLTNGTMALNVFYIISAYLLAKSLFENGDIIKNSGRGIVKRYFRLSLPLLLMNMTVFLLQLFKLNSDRIYGMFTEKYNLLDVFKSAFVDTMLLGDSKFNSMMWMMKTLFLGFIFTTMVCIIICKLSYTKKLIFMIAITVLFTLTDVGVATMMYGVLLYVLQSENAFDRIPVKVAWPVGIVILIISLLHSSFAIKISNDYLYYTAIHNMPRLKIPFGAFWIHDWIAAMGIMSALFICAGLRSIIDRKWIAATGSICFPMFLFSRVWEASFGELACRIFTGIRGNEADGVKASLLFTILISVGFSILYVKFIEPKINKLANIILTKLL